MLCKEVQDYISTVKGLPFFYVVGDEQYSSAVDDFMQAGLTVVRMSDFCPKEDNLSQDNQMYFRCQLQMVDSLLLRQSAAGRVQ